MRLTKIDEPSKQGRNVDVDVDTRTTILCSHIPGLVVHHLWPFFTDNDAISVLRIDRATATFFTSNVYSLRHQLDLSSAQRFAACAPHLLQGRSAIRIARIWISQSLINVHSLLSQQTALASLCLHGTALDRHAATLIATSLQTTPTLTSLSLNACRLNDETTEIVCDALKTNRSLLSLTITCNTDFRAPPVSPNFSATQVNSIASMLQHNNHITEFDLSYNYMSDDLFQLLLPALLQYTLLTDLNVGMNELTAKSMFGFGNVLATNTALTKLDISQNNIGDDAVAAICSHSWSSSLTQLDISSTGYACNTLAALASNKSLVSLDLGQPTDFEQTMQIMHMLKANSTLTYITVDTAVLEGDMMMTMMLLNHIITALMHNTTLTEMIIDGHTATNPHQVEMSQQERDYQDAMLQIKTLLCKNINNPIKSRLNCVM